MSKKRRTRKEKIASELKRKTIKSTQYTQNIIQLSNSQNMEIPQSNTYNFTFSGSKQDPKSVTKLKNIGNKNDINNYAYVINDIKKTLTVVGVILIINLGVFVLIGKNIISFKFLGL